MTGAIKTGSVYGVPHAELSSSVTTIGDIMFSLPGVPNGQGDAPFGIGDPSGELIMTDWNFFLSAASKSPEDDRYFGLNGVPPGEHLKGVCFSIALPPLVICESTSVLMDRDWSGDRNCTPLARLSLSVALRFGKASNALFKFAKDAGREVGIGGGGGGAAKPPMTAATNDGSGGGGGMLPAAAVEATAALIGLNVYFAMFRSSFSQTASVTLFFLQKPSTCLSKSTTLHRMWNSDGDDAFAVMVVSFNVLSRSSIDRYFVNIACCSTLRCKIESRFAVIWFHSCTNARSWSSLFSARATSICSFSAALFVSSSAADCGEDAAGGGGAGPSTGVRACRSWKPCGARITWCCGVQATEEATEEAAVEDVYDVSPD